MITFPHCKINLGLHVVAKRPDGYHDIETCFYPIPWTDILEIIPASTTQLVGTGSPIPGDTGKNLCIKAYELLKKDFSLEPVHMHLHKILPTGAGLGGGSSDGAFALKMLNDIFDLGLSRMQLQTDAAVLGSDCSFFLQDGPAIGSGKGDLLEPAKVSLSGKYIVIAMPDVQVSTADAYAGIVPRRSTVPLREIVETKPLRLWRELLKNDFEESVFEKYPAIAALKDDLYTQGAAYASMTGSGAAVYGIFEGEVQVPAEWKELTHWAGQL